VDHHADSADGQPERLGRRRVVDSVDRLDLQEVVARPETADLVQATGPGVVTDLSGVGVADRTAVLAAGQVARHAVTPFDRVDRPTGQNRPEPVGPGQPPQPPAAQPARDQPVEGVHQRLQSAGEPVAVQTGHQQAHPAGDVETHPAG
jgi:hypothetical protein